jgi:hypothetical protein
VISTALSAAAASNGPPASRYELTISTNDSLPIISFQAQAPDAQQAGRLVSAALNELQQYLSSVATKEAIPVYSRPVVAPLGSPVSGMEQRGPGKMYMVAASMVLFILLCSAVVIATGLRRGWREAVEAGSDAGDPAPAPVPRSIAPPTFSAAPRHARLPDETAAPATTAETKPDVATSAPEPAARVAQGVLSLRAEHARAGVANVMAAEVSWEG